MKIFHRRSRRFVAAALAGALAISLAACSSSSGGIAACGFDQQERNRRRHQADPVDPGSAGEAGQAAGRRVQLEPQEPRRPHGRAERRLRREGRRGRRLERPARPVRGRHRLRAQLGEAGSVPGHHRRRSTACPTRSAINQGHLTAGTMDGKEHVLPFVLDLSMMFWNKKLFKEAGLDPNKAPANLHGVRRRRQEDPGAEASPASTAPRPASTAAAASSSPGSPPCGPTASRS